MSVNSQAVTLWLPDLASIVQGAAETELKTLKLPALQTLLAKSDGFNAAKDDFYGRGCYLFHQKSMFPVAATMASLPFKRVTEDFWIRAEPVQMIPDRDSLVMIPPQELAMTDAELEALFDHFNQHFKQDGVQLEWGSHRDWYCRLPQVIDLTTTALTDAAYQNVKDLYPQGSAAPYWHQLINETQMLFYTHPVNEARRQNGQPEINSIWFWGEGQLLPSQTVPRQDTSLWSDHLYLKGLANIAQSSVQPAVHNCEAWSEQKLENASNSHLIHYDVSAELAALQSLTELLTQLEQKWFAPLLQQVQQQRIHSLLLDFGGSKRYHITPKHLQRFWRWRKSLESRWV
ncbi:hypothetical protein CYQ88_10015 [Hydrogenovibrio sp. SC-1]|uniref:hypothetical protein n=1 Tax=Hydrogenovibrio sp. SC-1 TaxID=2065820 RepID=UPI000C7A09FC|nr:hypothetical protein [Hydrogenovibrio sp. SC-1]PLA73649.1 hypothetical protein CYQ88_10015 [Hydrogenovibrio sp. SC-1]